MISYNDISPKERGRFEAGRGFALEDCPYDDPSDVADWQTGWRNRMAMIRRLEEETHQVVRRLELHA